MIRARKIGSATLLFGAVSSVVLGSVANVQAAAPIEVTVDWNQTTGQATKHSYGLNVFQGTRPEITRNWSYRRGMQYLKSGMLRYHNVRMLDDSSQRNEGWVMNPTTANYAWDRAKIARAMMWSYPGLGADRMMNIPGFPAYMKDANGRLKPEMYEDYAQFCADLVRITNQELGQQVRYWEITNEMDTNAYATDEVGTGRGMDEVGKIYRLAAQAMRSVDPTIKVGGPAMANVYNSQRLKAFLRVAYDQVDFVSFHSYSTYNPFDPAQEPNNQGVWQSAENRAYVTSPVRRVLNEVQVEQGPKAIELFHNEFNISSNYRHADPRMLDERGMIYDALSLAAIANSGVTGAMAWNEGDGIYGKLAPASNGSWTKRPSSHIFNLYNRYFRGDIVKTSAPTRVLNAGQVLRGEIAANKVTTFGVVGKRSLSLALINRSGQDQEVRVYWGSRPEVDAYAVSKNGVVKQRIRLETTGTNQVIPKDTVLFLVQPWR